MRCSVSGRSRTPMPVSWSGAWFTSCSTRPPWRSTRVPSGARATAMWAPSSASASPPSAAGHCGSSTTSPPRGSWRRSATSRTCTGRASPPPSAWSRRSRTAPATTLPEPGRGGARRMIVLLLAALALAYLAFLLLLRVSESRLLYAPGSSRTLTPVPPALGLAPERVEIPSGDGVTLVAWVIRAPATDTTGRWLLICHGNAGNLSDSGRPEHYAGLRALGLNLLAFDYRGYGESGGSPSEAGLYRDAEAAYGYLRDPLGVPPERIVLFGHSLGSAVAVELATRVPAAGLVLDGALTSVPDRAQEIYPLVPMRWIARSRYAS